MKNKKNKGFTLVELIVVLVILAILAAILVPALLGYIDNARNKQIILNARSAMIAAQAEMSNVYGNKKIPKDIKSAPYKDNLANTADFKGINCSSMIIGCKEKYDTNVTDKTKIHNMYTIDYVIYTETVNSVSTTIYFYKGEWVDTLDSANIKTADDAQYYSLEIPSGT